MTTTAKSDPKDAAKVFEEWRAYQRAPERCQFTDTRKKLLLARLSGRSAAEICTLIRYAYEADTPEARFWRGGNAEQREYLDLENLLRVNTLDSRLERALAWAAGEDPHDPDGPQDDDGADQPAPRRQAPSSPPPPPPAVQPVRGCSLRRPPRAPAA